MRNTLLAIVVAVLLPAPIVLAEPSSRPKSDKPTASGRLLPLKAAGAGGPAVRELHQRLFYAHLYLGLYSEAVGDETQAREHITKAVHEYAGADYMSDVARVHLILRESKKKSRANL